MSEAEVRIDDAALALDAPAPRRIFFLSNDVLYLYRFRGPVMQHFLARGYEVFASAPVNSDVDRKRIEAMGVHFTPWRVMKVARGPVGELIAVLRLLRIMAKCRPDILFAYTIKPVLYGTLVAWLLRVPRRTVMITGMGFAFLPGRGLIRRTTALFARAAYRFVLARVDVAIFQNEDDIASFRALKMVGARPLLGRVNGSGVDLGYFAPQPLPPGPPVFLYVGRLVRYKGLYELAEAARIVRKKLPDARFILLGSEDHGPTAVDPADLARWVSQGLVEHVPFVDDPRPYFAKAHVFVLPSYREGTPRAALEAMATARAIVTTDVPGCRETVKDGVNGRLVPARDAEALAAAMIELGSNPALAEAMGREGRRLCESRFELRSVVKATVDLVDFPDAARAVARR